MKDVEETFQKIAEYIGTVQPQIDSHNAMLDRFSKQAETASDVLVEQGIIPSEKADDLLRKLAEDPSKALDVVVKLARMIGPDDMGKEAQDVKAAAAEVSDPFDRLVLYGDAAATGEKFDGMVE